MTELALGGSQTSPGDSQTSPDALGCEDVPVYVSTETWDDDVWKYVADEFNKLAEVPLTYTLTEQKYEAKLHAEGQISGFQGSIAMIPPTQISVAKEIISLENAYLSAKYRFFREGMWQAPSVWALDDFLPVSTSNYTRPKFTDTMKSYGKDHIKQGYWYGFAKAVEHFKKIQQGADTKPGDVRKAEAAVQSFRALGSKCMFNIRFFKDSSDVKFETFQLLVGIEEQRDRWGLTFSRLVALIELAEEEAAEENAASKKIADETIHAIISKKITFPENSPICTVQTLNKLRQVSASMRLCPRLREVSRCAEAKYQRKQMFDEWTKVVMLIQKSDNTKELTFLVECAWLDMLRSESNDRLFLTKQTGKYKECANWSMSELKNSTGILGVWRLVYRGIHWFYQTYPWKPEDGKIMAKFKSPSYYASKYNVEDGTCSDKILSDQLKPSMQKAAMLLRHLHVRGVGMMKIIKGFLATPPSGGVDWKKSFFLSFCDDAFSDFEQAHALYKDPQKAEPDSSGLTEPGSPQKTKITKYDTEENRSERQQKKENARKEIEADIHTEAIALRNSSVVHQRILNGGTPSSETIRTFMQGAAKCDTSGRMVAVFVVKANQQATTYPKENYYKREAVVQEEDLDDFIEFLKATLAPGKDFGVIIDGSIHMIRCRPPYFSFQN